MMNTVRKMITSQSLLRSFSLFVIDRVRVYDKVGSAWVLRYTLSGLPESRFGKTVALSSGKYNVVR